MVLTCRESVKRTGVDVANVLALDDREVLALVLVGNEELLLGEVLMELVLLLAWPESSPPPPRGLRGLFNLYQSVKQQLR
jgi:hypothetical protein